MIDRRKIIKHSKWIMLALQLILIAVVGLVSKDVWYSVIISLIGVVFNLLVSYNIGYGFLFGFVYAITNGIIAYYSQIYATFGFMIIMQAPFALYSFYAWQKNKSGEMTVLKNMSIIKFILMVVFIAILFTAGYFLLSWLNSAQTLPDTFFFVFSVTACLLLALRYKMAFIITLLSGVCGTVLWFYEFSSSGIGLSIGVFYAIVTINSIIGVIKNYSKPKRNNIQPSLSEENQ